MCGIAGKILKKRKVNKSELITYSDAMQERGPDNTGYLLKNNIGLTHTRLSIIDLSEKSNQPMVVNDVAITFNGEIYNFKEIKANISGFDFKTNSDTEVLIAAYKLYGINNMLERLDGMFSFCIVDFSINKAFICRDIFGKKPLYYYKSENEFIFSSDIKPIQKEKKNELSINYNSLDYYLTELSVPQPQTIWNEINQVKPSCFIEVEMETLEAVEQQYWKLDYSTKIKISEHDAIIEVERRLKNAVLKRTVSDVPFATFLSGGIDSGLITSILARNTPERIKTYTIGFDFDDYDEFDLAKIVSEKYNTIHTEINTKINVKSFFTELINYIGEPFADPSLVSSYIVTKEFSMNVKLALSGDGGDEVFGGYHEYNTAFFADKYFANKSNVSNLLKTNVSKISNRINSNSKNLGNYFDFYKSSGYEKLYRNIGFSEFEKEILYKKESNSFSKSYLNELWNSNFNGNQIDTLFASSIKTRLRNDYLVKIDRASMYSSVEVRSPFLDKELVEFSFKLPNDIKLKNGINKYLLKKIVEKEYDKDIFIRKKQGFGTPIKYWLNNELSEYVNYYLSKEKVEKRGLFNYNYIVKLLDDNKKDGLNSNKIWILLVLEMWFDKFVD